MGTVDDVAEREFRFSFKVLNFFALHEFYLALQDFGDGIEFENNQGMRWSPNNGEHALRSHFSEPGAVHTARVKGAEKGMELYRSIFGNFPDYVNYDEK